MCGAVGDGAADIKGDDIRMQRFLSISKFMGEKIHDEENICILTRDRISQSRVCWAG